MAFSDTIRRWLNGVPNVTEREHLGNILVPIGDRLSSHALGSPALAITGGGSTTVSTGADAYFIVNGVLVKIASGTALAALSGTITAGKYNVFCFFVDSAGTVTSAMGTEGAAIANIVFPQFPKNKALVGFIIVTYASTFTGGSTPLDTATTVYVNPVGAFDPAVLTG